ncbi:hypothetical protein IEQ34_017189 [Dendrobium chrysotoxum]|uniref:Protein kinase domain-containing protein n=1 Tax=Dendrobium chrysotoxum TaxID=161865 RepID=A0AAV7FT93_DENCH|nr:hypothetical protein IEQ34_017189 [Dendrobium chrysotoxum]
MVAALVGRTALKFAALLLLWSVSPLVRSATNPSDGQALGILYISLNSPPQLTGWSESGGDPCGESWMGISCDGATVTAMISGLGLNGSLGYLLSDLLSLKILDVSNNRLQEPIPYQLPPNLSYMNLAQNNFSGNLPYSISNMVSLVYLNVSHNSLSQSITDFFVGLQNLSELDLSFNNLTGDLPISLSSLSGLSKLCLQQNNLTGPVDLLTNLNLTTLNIANNHFNGWIPKDFSSIANLIIDGNSFSNNLSFPTSHPTPTPTLPRYDHNFSLPAKPLQGSAVQPLYTVYPRNKKKMTMGALIGIVIGSLSGALIAAIAVVFSLHNVCKDSKSQARNSSAPLSIFADKDTNQEMQEQMNKSPTSLKFPPAKKLMVDNMYGNNCLLRRLKFPITATSYSVSSIQAATNSFNQEYLLGEGSLGRVYKAEFSFGKVFAVKKIDNAALSLQEEDNFLEAVANMSRLRHPNITGLVGYSAEFGQRLLVYEYIGNSNLHDLLHTYDDRSKGLNWNARVRVALGTARALEYLHEVCLPPVVHRNLKSANILLDEELNPKLSDCGAPEFAMSGIFTVKSDVYSLGIVMLELLTGRKPWDSCRAISEQSLVRWAIPQLHDIDALSRMVDPSLNGIYPAKSLSRFADIVALCVQPEPEFRPPMSQVVQLLVRLAQRASVIRRTSAEEIGISYRIAEETGSETSS